MEISFKQKTAESKPIPGSFGGSHANGYGHVSSSSSFQGLSPSLERALSLGTMQSLQSSEESAHPHNDIQKLKSQLQEQETKWKNAYEKLAKELDALKVKGAEAVVATQWRQRYEMCVKDKEELSRKLDLLLQLSNEVSISGNSAEQLFMDVEEDYKVVYCPSF
jgi:hypothetical protein